MNFAGPNIPPGIAIPDSIVKLLQQTSLLTGVTYPMFGSGGLEENMLDGLLEKLNRLTGEKDEPSDNPE